MKTPVSVIDLIIQRINIKDVSYQEALESINSENERLLNYLNQVLNILRIDDFEKDYLPQKVSLLNLICPVINQRKNQFIYNNVFPKVNIDKDIKVITDIKWSRVVINQIMSNAIKYSTRLDRKGEVCFSCKKENNTVMLIIKDNGIGIPKEDLNRIFEPFFTGTNGRKNKNSTGIGLYIVKCIIEKLNQKITVFSEIGKGTTIKISYHIDESNLTLM